MGRTDGLAGCRFVCGSAVLVPAGQFERVGVNIRQAGALEVSLRARRMHHGRQPAEIDPPPGQIAEFVQGDGVGPPRDAVVRYIPARDAGVIVEIIVRGMQVAQRMMPVEAIARPAAVIEVDVALVPGMQGIPRDAEQGREAGSRADEKHVLRLARRKIEARAGRRTYFDQVAGLDRIAEPGADRAAGQAFDVNFQFRDRAGQAGEGVTPDQAVGPAQVDELTRMVVQRRFRRQDDAVHRLAERLGEHHRCRLKRGVVIRRRQGQVAVGTALAGEEIPFVDECFLQARLRFRRDIAVHRPHHAGLARALAAGIRHRDAMAQQRVQHRFIGGAVERGIRDGDFRHGIAPDPVSGSERRRARFRRRPESSSTGFSARRVLPASI